MVDILRVDNCSEVDIAGNVYKQDGKNVLVKSDQGITTILNHDVNDFNAYGHP